MKRFICYLIFSLALLQLVAQAPVKGEIIYIEGEVNISRQGDFLPDYEVDMGLFLETDDVIRTGLDGYVEIELTYPDQGSLLKVQPDTVFFLEEKRSTSNSTVRVNLLTGAIGMKVSKLARNESLNVETQTAVMGIRGTEFIVNRATTGEILVTCNEGKVSCATSSMETFSEPGTVCAQDDGRDFVEDEVPVSQLDEYQDKWWDAREEALVQLGPLALEYYIGRYERQSQIFDAAWEELVRQEALLEKYEEAIENDEFPGRTQATKDKIALTPAAIKTRSALPLMEEIFYTLLFLDEYQKRGYFEYNRDKLINFNTQKKRQEQEMLKARYYLKLYGIVSSHAGGGSSSVLDDMLSGDPFKR
jgi:hypothetical protein